MASASAAIATRRPLFAGYPERIADILANPERKVTDIPGIGKGMAAVLQEICARGSFEKRDSCWRSIRPPRSSC